MGFREAATRSDALPGHSVEHLLGRRYALRRHLATGGMGEVWEATDTVLGREVAVKLLRRDLVESEPFLARFRAEARHTAALAHPGIACVYDYGEEDEHGRRIAYLVMELVPGEPLSRVLETRGALPVATALAMLAQAADALHAAHRLGIVHRDVKPGNLLVLDDGTVKITDFGVARAADSLTLTGAGEVIGTARYISPEQALGAGASPASDVYSLGVVGYETLAGHAPFTSDNAAALLLAHVHEVPAPLPARVPGEVRSLIARALAKDPADRPADAAVFAAELRGLAARTPGDDRTPRTATEQSVTTRAMPTSDRTAVMPFAAAQRRRRLDRRWLAPVVIVAAVTGVALLAAATDHRGPVAETTTTTTVAVTTTELSRAALIGRPVGDVYRALTQAGVIAELRPVDAPGVLAGIVTAIDPATALTAGSHITVDFSNGVSATTTSEAAPPGHGKGKGKHDD